MNINEVETFLTIIRMKNIRKASDVLFISQSAASQRLIMLEKKIGYSLIERKKGFKEVELTAYGKTFLPLAERWLELYQEMNLSKTKNIRVPLCIGAMGSINQPILAGFYSKLARGDYGISFDLKICTNRSDELYELLDKRKIDIGIVSEEYVYENIFVRKIFEEKMYVIMEKNDYDQNGYTIKPEELHRENEINISWSERIDIWHNRWWPIAKEPFVGIDMPSMLHHFLSDKNKWALCPSSMLQYFNQFEKVGFYQLNPSPPDRIIFLINHKYPYASKEDSINRFIGLLQDYSKNIVYDYEDYNGEMQSQAAD